MLTLGQWCGHASYEYVECIYKNDGAKYQRMAERRYSWQHAVEWARASIVMNCRPLIVAYKSYGMTHILYATL